MGRTKRLLLRELELRHGGVMCPGCEESMPPERLTKHHVLPRSMGGPTVLENLVLVCRPCHDDIHREPGGDTHSRVRGFLDGRRVPGTFPPPPEPMDAAECVRLFLCRVSAQAVRQTTRTRFMLNPPYDPCWPVGRYFASPNEPLRSLVWPGYSS